MAVFQLVARLIVSVSSHRAPKAVNSVVIRDCEDCTINGLHVSNVRDSPAAITIQRCRRMNISDCTILDCDNVGLLLDELTDSRISGCLIRDDRPGATSIPIKKTGGKGNLIDGNHLHPPLQATPR